MTKKYLFIIVLIALNFPSNTSLFAQRKNKKNKNKVENTAPKPLERPKVSDDFVMKAILPEYAKSVKKSLYEIAILLPLNLDTYTQNGNINKFKMPPAILSFINYYEGIKIAADELKDMGININVVIHDTKKSNANPAQLIKTQQLNTSDAILGMLQSTELVSLANFAKEKEVMFISAFSPSDAGIKNNPYFILQQPGIEENINRIIQFGTNMIKQNRTFVLHGGDVPSESAFKYLKNQLVDKGNIDYLLINPSQINIDSIIPKLKEEEETVFILNYINPNDANIALKQFAKIPSNYKIMILGMPSWTAITNLKLPDFLPSNITVCYPNPYNFEYKNENLYKFSDTYRTKYKVNPSEMALRGYETMMWLGQELNQNGTNFVKDINNSKFMIFNNLNFQHKFNYQNSYQYIENKQLYIHQYNVGVLRVSNL